MAASRPPRRGNPSSHGPRSKAGGPPHRGGPASRRPGHAPGSPSASGPPRRPFRPKPSSRATVERDEPDGFDRIQKILAHAGVGSRRACEELILQGRVTVGGQVVRELGTKVDPLQTPVSVDGQKVHSERPVYFAVFKPKGFVSTNNDPSGRPRVVDILPEIPQRVYTVGRLDEMSVGLMLLTNDGELANKLSHPRFGVEKLYRVVVAGSPSREVLDQITEGVWLAEGKVRAKTVRVVAKKGLSTVLEMVLAEGKNREVRRMLAKFGHKVMNLTRVAVGPITVKGLAAGQFRPLTGREIDLLRRVAAGEPVPMPWMGDRRPRRDADRDRPHADPRPPAQDGPRPVAADRRPAGPATHRVESGPPRFDRRPPGPGRPGQRFDDGPRRFDNHDDRRPAGRAPQGQTGGPPRPPRRFEDDARNGGPPRRFDNRDDRRPEGRPPQFRQNGPPQRSHDGGRPPQGQYGGPPRRFDNDRPPQRQQDGPPRRFDNDRSPQRQQDGPPRRFDNNGGGRPPQRQQDGPPRRFDNRDDRRPPTGPGGPRPNQGRKPSPPARTDGPTPRRVIGMDMGGGPRPMPTPPPAPDLGRDDRPGPRMKRPAERRAKPGPRRAVKPIPRRRGPSSD